MIGPRSGVVVVVWNMASQASLLDLKAITAEQAEKLQAEGKGAVRGGSRRPAAKVGGARRGS